MSLRGDRWVVALFLLLAGSAPGAKAPGVVLRDVAAAAGVVHPNLCGSHTAKRLILEENGSGGAVFDYDGDGDLDLYLVNGADLAILAGEKSPVRDALYRNDGGWRFVEVTATAGVGEPGWGFGVAVGDADGDGDPDLYVANFGPNELYENRGDGTFRAVGVVAGVADPGWGGSAAFADLDGDGDLDLYVTNYLELDPARPPRGGEPCDYKGLAVACGPVGFPKQPDRLYRNDGALSFTDVSESWGINAPDPEYGLGVLAADLDEDGLVDLYVANDSGPNFLFHNRGGGQFEEVAWLAGVATQAEGRFQAGMGVAAGDVDGDGRLDLFVTNFADDHNTLYLQRGSLLFADASYPSGLGGPSRLPMGWGTVFADLDHDGDEDLYVANGHIYPEVDAGTGESYRQADQLFLADGAGRFADGSAGIHRYGGPKVSRGVAAGDLDLDGDLDLLVMEMGETPTVLRNETGAETGASLEVELADRGGNRAGVGARLVLTAADRTRRRQVVGGGSYASASDLAVHFGLGGPARAERLEIYWPDGGRQRLLDLPVNRRLVVGRRPLPPSRPR